MKKIIIANWKMNPRSLKRAEALFSSVNRDASRSSYTIVICPPYPYISEFANKKRASNLHLGAQDAAWETEGPFTGEVSPAMLGQWGVRYVILGHSERRALLAEDDGLIARKVNASMGADLKVVVCVGEDSTIRKKGISAARVFVRNQIKRSLRGVRGESLKNDQLYIAYEPVWAISTSKNRRDETPEDAVAMMNVIRLQANKMYGDKRIRVLYGGSINKGNASAFLAHEEIDGALVGGASLRQKEFQYILTQT